MNLFNKIIIWLGAIAILGSCAKTDLVSDASGNQKLKITARASVESESETKMGYHEGATAMTFTWENSQSATESFSVFLQDGNKQPVLFELTDGEGTGEGTFSASINGISDGKELYAIYPNLAAIRYDDETAVGLNLEAQTLATTPDELLNNKSHYMWAESIYQTGSDVDFTFNHKVAILKVEITFPEGTGKIKQMQLAGVHAAATMDVTDGTLEVDPNSGGAVLSDENGKALDASGRLTAYFFLFPEDVTGTNNLILTAKDEDDNLFQVKFNGRVIKEGYAYTKELVLTKVTTASSTTGKVTYIFYGQTDNAIFSGMLDNVRELEKASIDQQHRAYIAFNCDEKVIGETGRPAYIEEACYDGQVERIETIREFSTAPKMGKAEKLADIIQKAKAKLPAQKYILILSGHGSGYLFDEDDMVSVKSAAMGGEGMTGLTLAGIKEGLSQSGLSSTELQLVYFDVCLCSTFEYASELSGSAQYMLGCPTLTPGRGGNYKLLFDQLRPDGVSFETAMADYMKTLCESTGEDGWNNSGGENTLITLTRLTEMQGVLSALGDYMTAAMLLRDGVSDKAAFDKETINHTFNYSLLGTEAPWRQYDIRSLLKKITTQLANSGLNNNLYDAFVEASKDAIAGYWHTPTFVQQPGKYWTGKGTNVIQPETDLEYTWAVQCLWTGSYNSGTESANYRELQISKIGKFNTYLEDYEATDLDARYNWKLSESKVQ